LSEQNAVATQKPTDLIIDNRFIDGLSKQLTEKEQYGLSFPPNYNVSNALNGAYLILQETKDGKQQPVLQNCSKQSVARALMDMAVQGLNPVKKQCYFVGFGGKLTLMRSYQGTMAVAKRVGVKDIVAEVIYDGDEFSYHIENGHKVIDVHKQDFKNIDTEKIIGAYAVLTTDNGQYVEIMNINQIKRAWKKGYGYKEGSGVHSEFGDQMAKKTVINRACKNFINSSDDSDLLDSFNNTTENEYIDSAEVEVQHDIETHANTEEFVVPAEPEKVEKVQGEVIDEPKKETVKEKKESKSTKADKVVDGGLETPSWMN